LPSGKEQSGSCHPGLHRTLPAVACAVGRANGVWRRGKGNGNRLTYVGRVCVGSGACDHGVRRGHISVIRWHRCETVAAPSRRELLGRSGGWAAVGGEAERHALRVHDSQVSGAHASAPCTGARPYCNSPVSTIREFSLGTRTGHLPSTSCWILSNHH